MASESQPSRISQLRMLGTVLGLGLYCINLGYGFDGTLTQLKDYTFTSRAFAGSQASETQGNRFRGTWLAQVPLPLPQQYLLGVDEQRSDFEQYDQPSYLLGQWKHGGWWYYYLYGLAVKTPLGSQILVLLALLSVLSKWHSDRRYPAESPRPAGLRDLLVLLAPAIIVISVVSSQTTFNRHLRYVLPALGFFFVLGGAVACWFQPAGGD